MKSERRSHRQKARLTTLPLLIDEGPDPDQTRPANKAEEITTPNEEDIKLDPAEEAPIPEAETTIIAMASTAISASSRATDKRNAGRG
jgi:hypothetical protein